MTSPSPSADLSKPRIDRDAPPPALRRAFGRNPVLGLLAPALVVGGLLVLRRGRSRVGGGG